jgi:hypothetical protein
MIRKVRARTISVSPPPLDRLDLDGISEGADMQPRAVASKVGDGILHGISLEIALEKPDWPPNRITVSFRWIFFDYNCRL